MNIDCGKWDNQNGIDGRAREALECWVRRQIHNIKKTGQCMLEHSKTLSEAKRELLIKNLKETK